MQGSPNLPEVAVVPPPNLAGWRQRVRLAENSIVVAALAVMVALPVAEIALRATVHGGVPASVPVVQHLVLIVGMMGGAIAARDNRLLALSTVSKWFHGRALSTVQIVSAGFAAAVSVTLAFAGGQFALSVRTLGRSLGWGVPVWLAQCVLVVGFVLITGRLLWHASERAGGRAIAFVLAAGLLAVAQWAPVDPAVLRVPALIALLIATVCGAPVFTALGGAALILLWSGGEPIASVPLKHYQLTVNPMLPSIPLFTLAGYFLAEGGAARRLVRLFQAWFGGVRGGPAIVTAIVCAFFTSFTGASGVTILALGGLLLPVLLAAGFRERSAIGLLTGAGSLGLLFPPCLPPILYSIIASSGGETSVSMQDMFKGGLLPGIVLVALTAGWGMLAAPKRDSGVARPPFAWREARAALWEAKWELLVPVVALTALFGGYATPVEAAALTALYAFAVETLIHRDLSFPRDTARVMTECGLLIGGVLLILGVALGFTHYLIDAQIPDRGVEWVTGMISSKWLFLLVLCLFLLVVGCLMDVYSAIVVVVPLLIPLGNAYGIHPIHLGVIFLANLELGFLTPPVGMNLFLASYRFNKPLGEVARAALPMLGVLLIGVLLITYVPAMTTWLPQLWR